MTHPATGEDGPSPDARSAVSQEDALREAQARYRHLFQQHPVAMAVWEPATGRILAANDAALTQYGYTPAEMVGLSIAEIVHPEDQPTLVRALEQLGGGLGVAAFFRHRRRDGSVLEVEVTGHDILWEGRPARVVMALDVTERRRLEEHLRQSQKMEAVGRLAGAVAHDFNNLLQAIDGYAALLIEELDERDDVRSHAEQIRRAALRARELTTGLLAFSRHQVVATSVADLHHVVREAAPMLERLLGPRLRLDLHLSATDPVVRVEATALEQAVVNLVVNARDAMPDGGVVRIATRDVVDRAAGTGEGGSVALLVTDTGTGMDEPTQRRAFEPFFTTKAPGARTGLGLATVYGTVQQARGSIAIETAPRAGTTVRIELPRASVGTPAAETTPEMPGPVVPAAQPQRANAGASRTEPTSADREGGDGPRSAATVLVVDDEPVVRTLAERILRRGPYQVLVASDAAAALELAGSTRPDVLVTDVLMPGMSGPELARALLAQEPRLPVLFVSGYTDEEIPEIALLGDQAGFLPKPFTPDALLARVAALLASRGRTDGRVRAGPPSP